MAEAMGRKDTNHGSNGNNGAQGMDSGTVEDDFEGIGEGTPGGNAPVVAQPPMVDAQQPVAPVAGIGAQAPQAPKAPAGQVGQQWKRKELKATINGDPEKLSYFVVQVCSYMRMRDKFETDVERV
uniref:Uncharacterized protein n=1 Tax=Sphaerodactylus townsendi TaxID=933632 RepID=A0ACB8FP47_9SAUR